MKSNEELTEEGESLRLHVAGATVRHQSPFSALAVPANDAPLSQEIVQKWVVPFYLPYQNIRTPEFVGACAEVTPEIARTLLAEFNWRPRLAAARFIAVRQFFELQPLVSTLLLRSDVCFAGEGYCVALAAFYNEAAAETLAAYLDYYLARPDLWFDQGAALVALEYLDELRGTRKANQFAHLWQHFIQDKPYWKKEQFDIALRQSLAVVEEIWQRMVA